jgi:hypothetical protein
MPDRVAVELGTPGPIALQTQKAVRAAGGVPFPSRNPSIEFAVQAQDVAGDGTVAWQSGSAPGGQAGVKRVFRATGFDHQGSYSNDSMRLLTCHLICKIAQDAA